MEPTASVSYGSYNYGLQIGVNHGAIQAGFHAPGKPVKVEMSALMTNPPLLN